MPNFFAQFDDAATDSAPTIPPRDRLDYSKESALRQTAALTPAEQQDSARIESLPAWDDELRREIANTRDPARRQILIAEAQSRGSAPAASNPQPSGGNYFEQFDEPTAAIPVAPPMTGAPKRPTFNTDPGPTLDAQGRVNIPKGPMEAGTLPQRAPSIFDRERDAYTNVVMPQTAAAPDATAQQAKASRTLFSLDGKSFGAGIANDLVIEFANGLVSSLKAGVDWFAPDSGVSAALGDFVKQGQSQQSDVVKAGRDKLSAAVMAANGDVWTEVKAAAQWMAENPATAAAQMAGNLAVPLGAVKGAAGAAKLAGAGEAAAAQVGIGTGAAFGGALAGGDAAGDAYDLVMNSPDDVVLGTAQGRRLLESGMDPVDVKKEIARRAADNAKVIPTLVGAVTGSIGVERVIAGAPGKISGPVAGRVATGLSEGVQEGIEEGLTTYEGRSAAAKVNPEINPMQGVGSSAAIGAVMGAGAGTAFGHTAPRVEDGKPTDLLNDPQSPQGFPKLNEPAPMLPNEGPQMPTPAIPGYDNSALPRLFDAPMQTEAPQDERRPYPDLFPDQPAAQPVSGLLGQQAGPPLVVFPDGSTMTAAEAAQRRLAPQPADVTPPLNQIPQTRAAAIPIEDGSPVIAQEIDSAYQQRAANIDSARADDFQAMQRAALAQQADVAPAVTSAQGFDSPQPTAMQAAFELAQQRKEQGKRKRNTNGTDIPVTAGRSLQRADTAGSGGNNAIDGAVGSGQSEPAVAATPVASGDAVQPVPGGLTEPVASLGAQGNPQQQNIPQNIPGPEFEAARRIDREHRENVERVREAARRMMENRVDRDAHAAASSPLNAKPEPSAAQIKANNAPLGHPRIGGLDISIENPAGSTREDKQNNPPKWRTKMRKVHYGYVRGVVARAPDKDHVDVFVREGTPEDYAGPVFVVDQNKRNGKFDEPKVMIGYRDIVAARAAYLGHYQKGWAKHIRGITQLSWEDFKAALNDPDGFMAPQVPVRSDARSVKAKAKMKEAMRIDPVRDSLFTAIGKLGGISKAQAVSEWGIDPADVFRSGIFGAPVIRANGGKSIDGMAELLAQYGYLDMDEDGKWDIRQLEERFRDEAGGSSHYTPDGWEAQAREAEAMKQTEAIAQEEAARLERQTEWRSMSSEQQEAELDSIFGPSTREEPQEPETQREVSIAVDDRSAVEAAGGTDGRAQTDEGNPRREDFALESQTEQDLAAKEARAADESIADRETADIEREAFTITPQVQERTTGATSQGGLFTPDGRATQAANNANTDATLARTRARNAVRFENPYVGDTGAKLVGYFWPNKQEDYVDRRGEDRVRTVSDWDEAVENLETGRQIVHQFAVVGVSGEEHEVSAETAAQMLGLSESGVRSSAKRLLEKEIEREKRSAQEKRHADEIEAIAPAETPAEAIESMATNYSKNAPMVQRLAKDGPRWASSDDRIDRRSAGTEKYRFLTRNGKYVWSPDIAQEGSELHRRGWRNEEKTAREIWPQSLKPSPDPQSDPDADIYDLPLADIKVKVKAIEAESGREIVFEDTAQNALKEVDSRLSTLRSLLQCLKS